MQHRFDEDITFKNIKADEIIGFERTFERCRFLNCDLSYADLSHITFADCEFRACNLSLIKLNESGLQNVTFTDCKMTGVNFSSCSNFSLSVSFEQCVMDYTIFTGKKLKGTIFNNCLLAEADFTEADLNNAVFNKCDLNRTIFNRTQLKGADFTTAHNFSIDPENNTLSKARFSADALAGLLTKYKIIIE